MKFADEPSVPYVRRIWIFYPSIYRLYLGVPFDVFSVQHDIKCLEPCEKSVTSILAHVTSFMVLCHKNIKIHYEYMNLLCTLCGTRHPISDFYHKIIFYNHMLSIHARAHGTYY